MSTWTSRVLAPLLLAACAAPGGPRSVQVGAGPAAFTLAAPAGWCLAPGSVTRPRGGDFAAFTPCSGAGAILTATAGPPGSAPAAPDPRAMAAFFTGPAGRTALSRAGDPRSVRVHEVLSAGGATLVRLTDRAPRPATIGPGESWRAVMALRGRLVTLTASPGAATPFDRDTGRQVIGRFVAAMRGVNDGG